MSNQEKKTEVRYTPFDMEIIKRDGHEDSRTIAGYALVFDKFTEIGGHWRFKEKIDRNALEDVDLSGVVATFNHNFDKVVARADSDTLKLSIDDIGLRFEFDAPATTVGNDLLENVRIRNVKGSSFMFTSKERQWTFFDESSEHLDECVIMKIDRLIELGPVVLPAYDDSTVDVKAAKRSRDAQMERHEVDKRYELRFRLSKI